MAGVTPTATGTAPNPGDVNATAPASIQAFGGVPQVAPTYLDPNQNDAYMQSYEQMVAQGLAPQFAAQQQQLQDSDAARGISSSGAAGYLDTQLQGQQAAAYAQGISPIISQGYSYTQADLQGNQAAANAASLYNANSYGNAETQNFGAYNNYLDTLLGAGVNDQNALQTAYLNSFGPNSGVESGYNEGLGGQDSTFSNVYGQSIAAQNQGLQILGTAAGDYFTGGAI